MFEKKIIAALLSVIIAISFTGCSKGSSASVAFFSYALLNFDREVKFNSSKLDEGDTIRLGYYDSKPLEWIVLKIEDDKMLVLSKYGLFSEDFEHRPFGENTWKDSNIRDYLNSEDLIWSLFTENEQAIILETELETDDNLFYGVDGGKSTSDKLFLLSIYDILENFDSVSDTKCTQPNGKKCAWWLRTPGDRDGKIAFIDSDGTLNAEGVRRYEYTTPGTMQTYSVLTIRPAMWVALDNNKNHVNDDYEDYEEKYFNNGNSSLTGNSSALLPYNNLTVTIGSIDNQALEWTVLDIKGDKALVLCNYGIAYTYLNASDRVYTWATCDVRQNMNTQAFLDQIFTAQEQELIVQTTITNSNNPDYGTSGGNSTSDKLFLLSADEVLTYFSSPSQTRCQAGRFIQQDQYFDWYWWLRTPGMNDNMASVVTPDGIVSTGGAYANDPNALIRPAMWIKLS